jgi:hypothetical protein
MTSQTVGALLYPAIVVEFHEGPDFYQVRIEPGERQPMHRWRVKSYRGSGWSTWRKSTAAHRRRWSVFPGQPLLIADADSDPRSRWPDVDTEAR